MQRKKGPTHADARRGEGRPKSATQSPTIARAMLRSDTPTFARTGRRGSAADAERAEPRTAVPVVEACPGGAAAFARAIAAAVHVTAAVAPGAARSTGLTTTRAQPSARNRGAAAHPVTAREPRWVTRVRGVWKTRRRTLRIEDGEGTATGADLGRTVQVRRKAEAGVRTPTTLGVVGALEAVGDVFARRRTGRALERPLHEGPVTGAHVGHSEAARIMAGARPRAPPTEVADVGAGLAVAIARAGVRTAAVPKPLPGTAGAPGGALGISATTTAAVTAPAAPCFESAIITVGVHGTAVRTAATAAHLGRRVPVGARADGGAEGVTGLAGVEVGAIAAADHLEALIAVDGEVTLGDLRPAGPRPARETALDALIPGATRLAVVTAAGRRDATGAVGPASQAVTAWLVGRFAARAPGLSAWKAPELFGALAIGSQPALEADVGAAAHAAGAAELASTTALRASPAAAPPGFAGQPRTTIVTASAPPVGRRAAVAAGAIKARTTLLRQAAATPGRSATGPGPLATQAFAALVGGGAARAPRDPAVSDRRPTRIRGPCSRVRTAG